MRKNGLLFWLGSAPMFCGAAFLVLYAYNMQHAIHAQKQAKEWLNTAAVTPTTPAAPPAVRPAVSRGDVIGELSIPSLNMSVMVFEGDDDGTLKLGAGHIPGTALPLDNGNIGIAAHRDTFFRPLRLIHPNDLITLRTPTDASRFAVTETEIVGPSDAQVLDPVTGRDLTLVTCYPFSYVGHAPQRFIVHAKRIG
jgi:sortase A